MRSQPRLEAMLADAMGPLMAMLADPQTTEIMVNPDGQVWLEQANQPTVCVGQHEARATEAIIRLVATLNQRPVGFQKPSLAGVLPTGERFQGWLPPRSTAPALCIRKPPTRVFTKADWVPERCTEAIWQACMTVLAQGRNMLICGFMSSGKTAFMNTMVSYIAPEKRVCTFEDTPEMVKGVPNTLPLFTDDAAGMEDVVRDGWRTAAQVLLIGEMRDGPTALNTFNLWLGQGGGIATIHAKSARAALPRVEHLCGGSAYGPRLAEVIDLIVYLKNVEGKRQVLEAIWVRGYEGGTYDIEQVA